MEKDILQRIAEECPGYSKRQMAIAKYISENSEIVAYMTAQMLAEAANVSESSVVRFARQFGFEGYAQLRRALQQRIKERIVSREEAAELDSRELGRLVSDGMKNLQGISTPQNERALEAAFHQLSAAKKILVQAGLGMEGLDVHLASGLNTLGFQARAVPEGFSREIMGLDESGVLVSISSCHVSGLLGPVRYAHSRSAGVLVLAEDESTVLRQYADVMLVGKGIAAAATLITALLTTLENNSEKNLEERLAELEALHREYHTYEFTEN